MPYNPYGLERSRFESDDDYQKRQLHDALVAVQTRDRDRFDAIPDDEPMDPDPELGSEFRGH